MLPSREEAHTMPSESSEGIPLPTTPEYSTPSPSMTARSWDARSASPSPRATTIASPWPPNVQEVLSHALSNEPGASKGPDGRQAGGCDLPVTQDGFNPQEDGTASENAVCSALSQNTNWSEHCGHVPTIGSAGVSGIPSQDGSIMMDVMRLMTRTGSVSSSGSTMDLSPATIVRDAQRDTSIGRSRDSRCSLSGTAVTAVLSALLAILCLGVVWKLFEEHNDMLCDAAIEVFQRSTRSLCEEDAQEERLLKQGEDELRAELKKLHEDYRVNIILALLCIFVCAATSLLVCGILVSRKLRLLSNLSKLMEKLCTLDFSTDSEEFAIICHGKRSSVREIAQLQDTFFKLFKGIALFARFVPETVVQRIVNGDRRATRLYVDTRQVTIMFSDIKDFTHMSEQLAQSNPRQLLFLLTRYFSIMSHIVEKYEGTVGEILGDGLLVFWNTPKNVRNHAGKACAAALAQQRALQYLNRHFLSLGLPAIDIRIGVNTGQVLSGNIGSFTKMKFGCMGDTVNLASRLEGLCKVYGTSIVCSGSTHEALMPDQGFLCRRLDIVQVKGRQTPTEIYEVVARNESSVLPVMGVPQDNQAPAGLTASPAVPHGPTTLGEISACEDGPSSNQILRIQDVVTEVTGGLHTMHCGARLESIWTELCEEDPAFQFQSMPVSCMSDVESVAPQTSVTMEQLRRIARYEEALLALQQENPLVAYELACELLDETPDDVATQRLRDKANQHCRKLEIVPRQVPSSFDASMSCTRPHCLARGCDSEMAITKMTTKGSN